MDHSTPITRALQQAIPNGCTAKSLEPCQRMHLGLQALAGNQSITDLATNFDVSRKFVYQQAATAQAALDDAFLSTKTDDEVLFHLPVTKAWLRQATLGLVFICHSSLRGASEYWRDLFGVHMAVGTVHNILRDAVTKARPYNRRQNLANVNIGALDELFQTRHPVLVGADVASTYCFLLSMEEHRDAVTWGVRLLELQERGFAPKATIADFGTGIRAGQKLAMPDVPCRGDVFHALCEVTALVSYLENRAYETITTAGKLERKKTKTQQQGKRSQAVGRKAAAAGRAETQAVTLADDIALLACWLHYDIFAVSGLAYTDRCALYDFILTELKAREQLCPHRIGPIHTLLKNHRSELLAFASQLDREVVKLAEEFQVPELIIRAVLDLQRLDEGQPRYWREVALLQRKLHHDFYRISEAVQEMADQVVRASSVIENLNSRLRSYFFLRRQLGSDYLELLQFFLNHRRFLRSEHAERVGKSPAELLTGVEHPHWLEMLGYTRFCRN